MKKAQAAMEFLMTYGWAILVVLLAIAALAYFGVLNPGKYLPSSCTFPQGLGCVESMVDSSSNNVTLVIQNGMGQSLNSLNISVGGDCVGWTAGDGTLSDGEKELFNIHCTTPDGLVQDSKFKEDITIQYLSENDLSRTIRGTISTRIE